MTRPRVVDSDGRRSHRLASSTVSSAAPSGSRRRTSIASMSQRAVDASCRRHAARRSPYSAHDGSVAALYPDWAQHNARLRDAVRFLTAEQLEIRAGPEHGTLWQLAAHAAGARVVLAVRDPRRAGRGPDPVHGPQRRGLGGRRVAPAVRARSSRGRWTRRSASSARRSSAGRRTTSGSPRTARSAA